VCQWKLVVDERIENGEWRFFYNSFAIMQGYKIAITNLTMHP